MSKFTKAVKNNRREELRHSVENFMGGISFEYDPIDTLKMVTASSIFGEPQYYRAGLSAGSGLRDAKYHLHRLFAPFSVLPRELDSMKTSELMENIIDKALDYDFRKTLEWAVTLRNEYNMRLNPQIIMVRAAIHPKRQELTKAAPGFFAEIQKKVMRRADEPVSQLEYYLFKNGKKNNLPNILKRSWASRLEGSSIYELHKYKNSGIGIIDTVRISHASSGAIDELMKTGTVRVDDDNNTWESKRASGATWREILSSIKLGHMALLRNLRGIFTETEDSGLCGSVLEQLKKGVPGGKQFPFRYYSAYSAVKNAKDIHHKGMILDALEECVDISCENMPMLKGRTMCLSDNSGSAWGTFNSEYGSVTVAEIGNLSSLITARNSEEGYIGRFGDRLLTDAVSKRDGLLRQNIELSSGGYKTVGGNTENGIWLFFRDAIDKKEHWDNIFIYSDQQAGHGGLYGTDEETPVYRERGYGAYEEDHYKRYIDVSMLIADYRRTVNPKVNVFSVQTAGYDNAVVPEYGYRTNLLYGWTGRELLFADTMIKFWDDKEAKVND